RRDMSSSMIAGAVVVAWALALIVVERMRPYDHQKLLRKGLDLDLLWYALVQSYLLGLIINGVVRKLDAATGASSYGLVSSWPFIAQVTFFVITHDFYIYWFHRLQHSNRWLWRLHEAHHSVREVDWIAGARSHAGEIFINQTIEVGAMVLLGATPEVML